MKPEFPITPQDARMRLLGMFSRFAIYVLLVPGLVLCAAYAFLFRDNGVVAVVLLFVVYQAHRSLAPTRNDFETMDALMTVMRSGRE